MTEKVRTRFAPSPTGYLHVGGARTALYNFLYARRHGGTFILRIEDTDRERSEDRFTQAILDSLSWLGINWDEGPVFQSQRLDRYREAAEKLLASGEAYCDEDPEKGRAVKMRMPRRIIKVPDLVHDEIEFDASLNDDFVIIKSDGFPAYNFACVVDDADLAITHVIRGDEHLSNMPRQLVLYEALGLPAPQFAHIPMILGPDGAKLSKRHGATSVTEYHDKGFLPEALANFVALLGWSPGNDLEIMSIEDMCGLFDLSRARKNASRFDNEKLMWMNGQYLMNLPAERLAADIREYLVRKNVDLAGYDDVWMTRLAEAYRIRIKTLDDLYVAAAYVFADEIEYDPASMKKVLEKEGVLDVLSASRDILAAQDDWASDRLEERFRVFCEETGRALGKVAQPIRVAVTGSTASPPIFETLALLGRDKSLSRIDSVLKRLPTASSPE